MASPTVMTVLGPIPADALGVTMPHEHVFFDLGSYFIQAADDPDGTMAAAPVTTERLWWIHTHWMNNRDNLVHDSLEVAVAEVAQFKAAGGDTLVDVTTIGIAPNPKGLREVSQRTGVQIVAATGYYVAPSYPASVADLSVEELADHMRREILEGIGGTNIRAGIIGELGVSNPPAPVELRVLAAAARIQRELDCAVNIHTVWGADSARLAARMAEKAGLNPQRTVLSHLDNRFPGNVAGFREIGGPGFWLELDNFGRELYWPGLDAQMPSDADRIRTVLGLLDAGMAGQVLLSEDICFKHELVKYGGRGYAHVLRTIRPRLLRSGVDSATLQQIAVDNPRKVLAGA